MTWPATVRSAERGVVDEALLSAVTLIVSLPLPEVFDRCAHVAPLPATHAQFAPLATTPIEPTRPPSLPNGLPSEPVLTVTLHARGSCVIVKG